ncbi:MAG: cytochrome P460 family protein [Planctomycetales bacterium]|nr:cytochrome P460 family protein [Planctomycetales bacterium]
MKRFHSRALVVLSSLPLVALGFGSLDSATVTTQVAAADSQSVTEKAAASYDAKGELIRPADHREWIFVGAPVTPNDMNDGKAAFPEFHNVYIDPVSFASYKQTGTFPDGTVILKELVSVGGKSMDSGNGYFQGEFTSLEAMVKDRKRFTEEPGGWAFFRFGEAPNYNPTGARMKTESCNACHSGANEDYVFTDTYPVLRAAKAQVAK